MTRLKSFIKTTLTGGLLVILPATILFAVFRWIYLKLTNWIQPLTDVLLKHVDFKEFFADLIVMSLIVITCFGIGLVVRTKLGKWLQVWLETKILKAAPGYNMIRETVNHFLGRKKSPFSSVALVQLYDSATLATAFVTDEHPDGSFTVFVPTGPNPTSGQIFHLQKQFVQRVDVAVDEAMRSILSCGAGSTALLASRASPRPAKPLT